uniref:F-box domain-containing protein n=1 Tax=Solanum lycopersicum TaxID=4081 RepID=A0A3Q7I7X0_SOLLC
MTETRTCEFGHIKKTTMSSEDGVSGLPCFGVEDDKGGILEDRFAEKGKKKRRICEMGWLSDPLVVLGTDVMLMILSCLDARSVALCLLVSRGWRAVASSDKIWSSKIELWDKYVEILGFSLSYNTACVGPSTQVMVVGLPWWLILASWTGCTIVKCEELWRGKTHLPRLAKVNDLSKLVVYSLSVMDGKRKRIRKEDLYDHVWEFHFTEAAPEYWRMLDPYRNGTGRPLRRYFLPDGSQTAEPDDKIWGGHESCYSIVTSLLADGNIREHYVRINRWPPMYVTRKEDWSWEISNNFCTYKSIPDADKKDGTGPLFLLH